MEFNWLVLWSTMEGILFGSAFWGKMHARFPDSRVPFIRRHHFSGVHRAMENVFNNM